jgi:hypothetical protein
MAADEAGDAKKLLDLGLRSEGSAAFRWGRLGWGGYTVGVPARPGRSDQRPMNGCVSPVPDHRVRKRALSPGNGGNEPWKPWQHIRMCGNAHVWQRRAHADQGCWEQHRRR